MTRISLFIFVALSFFCNIIHAESLDNTALLILKGSKTYESENYSFQTVEKQLATESNLPDPSVNGEYLFAPDKEDNRWAADISWDLEWPGVYGARALEAKKRIATARLNLKVQRMENLAEIKCLLLDYILVNKKLSLLGTLNENNDSIYILSRQATEQGEMTVLDLNKVRIEYANIRGAIAALLAEKESIMTSLAEKYGADCSHLIEELPMEFPEICVPDSTFLAEVKHNSSLVAAMESEIETSRAGKKVAAMEALPALSLGYKHAFEEDSHFNGVLLGLSIPLFSSKGKQKAANAAIAEAEFKKESAQLSSMTQAQMLAKKLSLLKSQIDEIEPVLRNSDHNSLLLKAFEKRAISMIDYLSERNYFTTAAMEFLSLHHEAAVTQAKLQKFYGDPAL